MRGCKSFETTDLEQNATGEKDEEEIELFERQVVLSKEELLFSTVHHDFLTIAKGFFFLSVLWMLTLVSSFLYCFFNTRLPSQKFGLTVFLLMVTIEVNLFIGAFLSMSMASYFASKRCRWKYLMVLIGMVLAVFVFPVYMLYPSLDEEFPEYQYLVYMIVITELIPAALNIALFLLACYKTQKIVDSLHARGMVYQVIHAGSNKIGKEKEW